jgi:hypothetical protein
VNAGDGNLVTLDESSWQVVAVSVAMSIRDSSEGRSSISVPEVGDRSSSPRCVIGPTVPRAGQSTVRHHSAAMSFGSAFDSADKEVKPEWRTACAIVE